MTSPSKKRPADAPAAGDSGAGVGVGGGSVSVGVGEGEVAVGKGGGAGVGAGAAPPPKKPAAAAASAAWANLFAAGKRNSLAASSAAQTADVLLILDLETTCDAHKTVSPQETIEMGVCAVELKHPKNGKGNGASSAAALPPLPRLLPHRFHSYVKPTEYPSLTDFCIELTKVTQPQVDAAPPVADVLAAFERWLADTGLDARATLALTWTTFDLGLALGRELVWRKLAMPRQLREFSDLKRLFGAHMRRLYGVGGSAPRLKQALEMAGLRWEGREHSALDDAVNTGRLAMALVERGVRIEATGVAAGCGAGGGGGGGGDGVGGGGGGGGSAKAEAGAAAGGGGSGAAGAAAAAAAAGGGVSGPGGPGQQQQQHPAPPQPSAPAPKKRQVTLAPPKNPPPTHDAQGRWQGRCRCGADAQRREVRRPGATQGKVFYSCGKWTMATGKGECDLFLWADAVPPGSTLPPERRGGRRGGGANSGGGGGAKSGGRRA